MITKFIAVISRMLLPTVPILMCPLICVLIMHVLNGGNNDTTQTSTVHLFCLFNVVFKVILKLVRFMNVTSIKFSVPANLISSLLFMIVVSIKQHSKDIKFFSYKWLMTLP